MEALRKEVKHVLRQPPSGRAGERRHRHWLTRWSRSSPCPCRPSPSFWAVVPDSHLSSCNFWSPWSCWFGCNSGRSSSNRMTQNASLCFLFKTEQYEKQVSLHRLQTALFNSNKMPNIYYTFPCLLCPHSAVTFEKTNRNILFFFIC